jgi:hypothetical protein
MIMVTGRPDGDLDPSPRPGSGSREDQLSVLMIGSSLACCLTLLLRACRVVGVRCGDLPDVTHDSAVLVA